MDTSAAADPSGASPPPPPPPFDPPNPPGPRQPRRPPERGPHAGGWARVAGVFQTAPGSVRPAPGVAHLRGPRPRAPLLARVFVPPARTRAPDGAPPRPAAPHDPA